MMEIAVLGKLAARRSDHLLRKLKLTRHVNSKIET
jgi:hypothetical protein